MLWRRHAVSVLLGKEDCHRVPVLQLQDENKESGRFMECPLVSLIVPVYNAQRTIERCLTSIHNQSYQNIEVLVIDDGSTDHTLQILEKMRQKDDRFVIISKANTGVSDSRNIGIRMARGKYIQFADGDDWFVKYAVELCVRTAEESNCDMIISDFYRVVGRNIYKKGHIKEEGLIDRQTYAEYMMQAPANFYYGVLWNKFFKADIIHREELLCSPELNWCEDFQFNMEYLQFADKIYVQRSALYYYVKTKGSLVDTEVNFQKTVQTKKQLFTYYKALYENLDMYKGNRLKIQLFYIAFAMDRTKKVKTA